MKKSLILALTLAAALVGCGGTSTVSSGASPPVATSTSTTVVQQAAAGSPEAQIVVGAQGVTAATTTAAQLLRAGKLTLSQAESYRVVIGAASTALHGADTALQACRKTSGPAPKTGADPCTPSVGDLVVLAVANVANIKRVLDAME